MTIPPNIIDAKLKNLIKLCTATQNYKKLAVVGFILVSNTVDEISSSLGIRARKKKESEHVFAYLQFVNDAFYELLQLTIIPAEIIEELKLIELLFLKLRGDIPLDHIKDLYEIYFELRKIEVPNVYKSYGMDDIHQYSDLNLFLSLTRNTQKKKPDNIRQFLAHSISQKEHDLRKSIDGKMDKDSIEQAIMLHKLKTSLTSKTTGRIKTSGKLQTNIFYQLSQQQSLKYILLGGIILFIMLSIVVIWETILFPSIILSINLYLAVFLGIILVLFMVYRHYFQRGGDS